MREIRSLARKVRILRSATNMSVNELSDRSGISPRSINRMEAADMVGYNPQLKTVASVARVFGFSLSKLLETPVNDLRTASAVSPQQR